MQLEQKVQGLEKDKINLHQAYKNQGAEFINLRSSFHETEQTKRTAEQQLQTMECEINVMKYEVKGCYERIQKQEAVIQNLNLKIQKREADLELKNLEIEQLEQRTFMDTHADYIYNMSNQYIFKKQQ